MRVSLLSRVVLAAGIAACSKEAPPPGQPAVRAEAAPPDGVVVTVSSASLTQALDGLRAFADAVRPGAGAGIPANAMLFAVLGGQIGAGALDGLDLSQPVHLVVIDGPSPVLVLVARVADSKRLAQSRGGAALDEKDGWAVLGAESGVKAVAGWARSTLVPRRVSAQLTATAYVDRLKANHAAEIARFKQQMSASFSKMEVLEMYGEGLASVVDDVNQATVSLAADGERFEVDIGVMARAGSRLAAFAAAQQPSDFALFQKLPASTSDSILFGGRLSMGPYREGLVALGNKMMGVDGTSYAEWMSKITALATGDVAATGSVADGAMTMVQLFSVTDGVELDRLLREQLATMAKGLVVDSMGMKMTMTGVPEITRHGGVAVRGTRTTIDLATVPEMNRAMIESMYGDGLMNRAAVVDKRAVVTIGGEQERIVAAIDALQGKARGYTPGPEVTGLLEESRRRRESLLMAVDLAAFRSMMQPGAPAHAPSGRMVIGLGVSGAAIHMRVGMSAKAVSGIVP